MRGTAMALLTLGACGGLQEPAACIAIGYCDRVYTDVGQVDDSLLEGAFVELCVGDQCITKVTEVYFGQRNAKFPELFATVTAGPLEQGATITPVMLEVHGDDSQLDLEPTELLVRVSVETFERAVVTSGSWVLKSETRIHPSGDQCGRCRSVGQ